jgi:Putative T7SS secretion signal domain
MVAGAGILGDYAIPGDVAAVDGSASRLRTIASDVQTIQARVVRDGLHGSWSGHAADAFRQALGEVPGELEKLCGSFTSAAAAMQAFASSLADAQSRADWLATKIEQEQSAQRDAERRHDTAQSALRAAERNHAGAPDPISQANAQVAVDHARSNAMTAAADVQGHQEQLSSLMRAAQSNYSNYEQAVSVCCQGLDLAGDLGIKNDPFGGIKRFVGGAFKDVGDVVSAPVHWAEHTWKDAEEFFAHPSWKAFRSLLEDARAPLEVAGVLLIAASAVLAPEAVIPLLLAASRIETAVDGLETAGDLVEAGIGNAAQKREADSHLGEDGVNLAMDVVGLKGAAKLSHELPALQKEWQDVGRLGQNIARDRAKYALEPKKYQWKSAITTMTNRRYTLLVRRYSRVMREAWESLSTKLAKPVINEMVKLSIPEAPGSTTHQIALPLA